MSIQVTPELERRLQQLAERQSLSVSELVEQILTSYLSSLADDSLAWVRTTQDHLDRAWPAEHFADWQPPDAS